MDDRNERVTRNLNSAVSTMRDACEDAARAIARGNDQEAVRRVLHTFSWGWANASVSIENAMSALEDAQEVKESK